MREGLGNLVSLIVLCSLLVVLFESFIKRNQKLNSPWGDSSHCTEPNLIEQAIRCAWFYAFDHFSVPFSTYVMLPMLPIQKKRWWFMKIDLIFNKKDT